MITPHPQRILQTRGELPNKIRFRMSNLDLLSGLLVVNGSGEKRSIENGISGLRPIGTQQPHLYNPRKQRDFSTQPPNGEPVWS